MITYSNYDQVALATEKTANVLLEDEERVSLMQCNAKEQNFILCHY